MALFRKFFYRKPPDGLLEISERVYVFDCCFALDVLDDEEYKVYVGGVVSELREYFSDASFVVFNLRNGENRSQIADILSEYGIIVMDYPSHYENCPLLTMEMIHHFLKSSESWLSLGQRNVLLMHCERGAWPVLAFMLAALLIYKKQYTGEEKTLNMIYKQTPQEVLQLMLPLNPVPSQLRYLQYVSRRNLGSEWPPLVRALTLDCIILRVIPNMDGEGGCRPIFRIYGPDPFMAADRTTKVLFSTPKRSKMVRRYKQADSELVKIDINCHIQGDVVLECITLDNDLEHEEMMFRIMFNTAFIRSNILILNPDEIDTLWNAKDNFSEDFRAEVLFSEMNSSSSVVALDLPVIEDKGGLPIEAFAKVQEKFRNVDWRDLKADPAPNMLRKTASNIIEENLENFQAAGKQNLEDCSSKSTIIKTLKQGSTESAKEQTCETISFQIARNEGLETVPSEAYAKVQEYGNMDWLDPNTDVALNILQITASNIIQERLENFLAAGKEKKNSSFPWSASTGILESVSSESSRKERLKAAETPSSYALEHDIISSPLTALKVKSTTLSESFLDLNSLGKKRETNKFEAAFQSPLQSEICSPQTSHGSVSTPASFANSLQDSPAPLSKYHSVPSSLGITALLHDNGESKSKVGAHVVTLSPRSALSASFPHLCKPVPPNFFSVVLPAELSSSASASSSNLTKVSAVASPSLSPPLSPHSSMLTLPKDTSNAKLMTKSQLSPRSVTSLEEWDSLSKSNSETLAQDRAVASSSVKNSLESSPPHLIPSSLPKTPLSTCPVAYELQEQSLVIDTITNPPPSLPPHHGPESSATAISPPPPSPPLPPAAFSSSETVSATLKYSSSTYNLCPSPIPERVSSPGLISLITPVNNLQFNPPAPPPPPPPPLPLQTPPHHQNLGSISSAAAKMSEQQPPQPPPSDHQNLGSSSPPAKMSEPPPAPLPLPPLPPPPPPPPPSPTSSSLRMGPSPIMDPLSTVPPSEPPSSGSFSSIGPISSPVLEESSVMATRPPPPPPPPLHSSSFSNHSASSSAPAPPPPPSIPPNKSTSKLSQHGPPIPPPLAPFSNSNSQNRSISGPGNIPPTPAPPLGSKGRLLLRSIPKNQSQMKKASLKPYHWLKLTRAMQGSLWAEAQKPEEASTTPEFDMSELESLFSASVPNSDHGNSGGKSSRASRKKSEKVNLIDLRRAYNCEIMLTKVKIPLPDLMSSVLALDDSAFDVDQVENLIKFCPTKEEMELLQNYKGDKENLGKCEQFFLELMKVPRVESKLRVFSFKMQFSSQVSDLRNSLNLVNSASEEIRNSVKLKRIMQTILSLGNALNHGTARGSAVGFRLDSLLKLTDTRARNNKMTLMHYLCKVLAKKLPELLDFPKDLANLEAAAKIQLKYLAEEMQAISKGLEKVVQELAASENDGHVSESFCKVLKQFLHFAEAEVKSLASLYSGVGRNADALALYFGEDPARCPFEQVVSTLLNFVRMFARAHDENCKQLEFERKRAMKEAENEKAKLKTSTNKSNSINRKKDDCDVPKT